MCIRDRISLVCRAIAFADIIVKGRAGHLERTPGNFREGDSVDAIEKARYIMAVSYTHLDVYKRQELSQRIGVSATAITRLVNSMIETGMVEELSLIHI